MSAPDVLPSSTSWFVDRTASDEDGCAEADCVLAADLVLTFGSRFDFWFLLLLFLLRTTGSASGTPSKHFVLNGFSQTRNLLGCDVLGDKRPWFAR